jgi:hypothetical protein
MAVCNYAGPDYHSNDLLSCDTLHELKLYSRSRKNEQSFISAYLVYSLLTDNFDMWIIVWCTNAAACYSWEMGLNYGVDASLSRKE